MPTPMHPHAMRLLLAALLMILFLCGQVCASALVYEGVGQTPRVLLEGAKDGGPQDQEFEDGVADLPADEDGGLERNAVAVDKSFSQGENISQLLTRDYLRQFDIPIVFNDSVDHFIRHFTVQKRKVFTNWLKRAKRYAPTIREILREQGLPEDLVYLAMIESGFNPKAYSPMKACGPWQFIYETGERYGLRVNYWVDERRDPQKSTVAAARYLKDLFNQFGCWYLAAAGYNAGENRVERAIAKHETNDFWELRKFNTLPRETREYIPQLIAAAIIGKDPSKFGLSNIPFDAPVPFSVHRVPGGTPLTLVADAARFDLLNIQTLNPEILRGITPPGTEPYPLKLPDSVDREDFRERLRTALQDGSRVLGVTAHTIRRKESLLKITRLYGINQSDLMLVNAHGGDLKIVPGAVVYIPRFERDGERRTLEYEARPQAPEKEWTAPGPDRAANTGIVRGYHIVRRGESLTEIARRYGLSAKKLREMNDLESDKIRPNTRLVLFEKVKVSTVSVKGTRTPEQTRALHVVRKGENLASISEKYGTDTISLKKINNLKGNRIVPTMRLEVRGDIVKAQQRPERTAQVVRTAHARPAALYHVVKKGENLKGISERYRMNMASLKKMNGLKKDMLQPGMHLRIASR